MSFSRMQRGNYEYSRYCVAREGHSWLCPHAPLSLAMIKKQVKGTYAQTYQCKDPMCPSARTILEPESGNVNVDLEWEARLPSNASPATTVASCFRPMISQLPQIFCPHVRMNMQALSATEYGQQSVNQQETACKICSKEYYCNLQDQHGQGKYGTSHLFQWKGNSKPYDSDWIYLLDPRTFGFFDDPMWKHIAWCDDTTCATPRGLLRLMVLWEFARGSNNTNEVLTRLELDEVFQLLLQRMGEC